MAQHRPDEIVVKSMLLIRHDGKILVSRGYDKNKNQHFYRFLGGSLNFGETTEQGIRREIQEELKCEIENLHFIEVIENIYTYEGESGHQIIFLYRGDLSDKSLCDHPVIHIIENTYEFDAVWIPISEILKKNIPLYPEYDYSRVLS